MITKALQVAWDIFKTEFVMRKVENAVTVFGSARVEPGSGRYNLAMMLGTELAKKDYVITGGGPGVMEATNLGAFNTNPEKSIGIGIRLPREEHLNAYLGSGYVCKYFCARKFMISRKSKAFVIFPGGIGTLDELAEMLTLIATDKTTKRKIIMFDSEYHRPLLDYLHKTMVVNGMITKAELNETLVVTDFLKDILKHIYGKKT